MQLPFASGPAEQVYPVMQLFAGQNPPQPSDAPAHLLLQFATGSQPQIASYAANTPAVDPDAWICGTMLMLLNPAAMNAVPMPIKTPATVTTRPTFR